MFLVPENWSSLGVPNLNKIDRKLSKTHNGQKINSKQIAIDWNCHKTYSTFVHNILLVDSLEK